LVLGMASVGTPFGVWFLTFDPRNYGAFILIFVVCLPEDLGPMIIRPNSGPETAQETQFMTSIMGGGDITMLSRFRFRRPLRTTQMKVFPSSIATLATAGGGGAVVTFVQDLKWTMAVAWTVASAAAAAVEPQGLRPSIRSRYHFPGRLGALPLKGLEVRA